MAKKGKKSSPMFAAILLLVLLVGSFISALVFLNLNSGPEVSIVGCPVDESYINKNIAILFDTTEPMIPSQAREIENRMALIISNLDVFDRVAFYELRSDEVSAVRRVTLTLGSQSTEIDHFCRQQASWEDSPARVRLNEELPRLISQEMLQTVEQGVQSFSPITDALRFIAADVSGKPFSTQVIVVSDMIEHSRMLSMYKSNWFENAYVPARQTILNQRPIFPEGTEIEVFLLNRAGIRLQNEELQQYWAQMLTGPGAFSSTRLNFNFVSGGM
jgi:hypothetical protein